MSTDSPMMTVIVHPDHHEILDLVSRRLGDTAFATLDRRREERRQKAEPIVQERRQVERRRVPTSTARDQFRRRGCRFIFDPRRVRSSDLIQYAPALCVECEGVLEFEMPRFFEAPATLEVEVRHKASGLGAHHTVYLEALEASGRPLLTSELSARESR